MNKKTILTLVGATLLGGCVNDYGHIRPPDPLGRLIFDVFDPPPKNGGNVIQEDGGEYIVPVDMPAARYETRPGAPGPGLVWINGYWSWNGSEWIWVRGHWVEAPRRGARWVTSKYYIANGQRHWRPGYWQ
ncbi:MAG: hypothetical protein ABI615_04600 [Chthoniobacterales bacterium]